MTRMDDVEHMVCYPHKGGWSWCISGRPWGNVGAATILQGKADSAERAATEMTLALMSLHHIPCMDPQKTPLVFG